MKLHWKILLGMVVGALFGILMNKLDLAFFVIDYVKPVGTIFIRLITMIAVPLVFASLIVGASSLKDTRKLSRIGGKTIAIFILTTAISITIGLVIANIVKPGEGLDPAVTDQLKSKYSASVGEKVLNTEVSIVDEIINIVPQNPFYSLATKRGEMMQVVFFALFLGIVLTQIKKEKALHVVTFFEGVNDAMIKIIEAVMLIAPFGVFALIAAVVADFGFEILKPLGKYCAVVVFGLIAHTFITYGIMVKIFSKIPLKRFFKGMTEVQLLAFSSSSSAATLPVNMRVCERKIGIKEEVTSFVLPVGATVNMDGTALYQGVATLFIAQVYGIDLTFGQQITIVLTATLASIGTAAVPGVGMIMLVIVLQTTHVPTEGIALIFGVDRILDMLRTTVNITGDAATASVIASQEGLLYSEEEIAQMNGK